MERSLNENEFTQGLAEAVGGLDSIAAFGLQVAPEIDRIYMIACGAGFHIMEGVQYWADQVARKLEIRTFRSADYTALNPPKLNARTLVLLTSKSGETPETLDAAKLVRGTAGKTVVITQSPTSSLATHGDKAFFLGDTQYAFLATFMLTQAFVGAILENKEQWGLLQKLLSSLRSFPEAVVSAARQDDERGKNHAERYKNDGQIYFVASGPGDLVPDAFGRCVLTEMLKIHVHPIKAGDFFHSTLEIINRETPLILVLTEDLSRKQMERVKDFCKTYGGRVAIYDSVEYPMEGIDKDIRPIVAPYVVEGALKRFAYHLSVETGRPLSARNYMGRVKY